MHDMNDYFASTEFEALSKYNAYKSSDPFPQIPPALLSSAQIQAYIAKAGMVFPYFPARNSKEEKITSATLTMTIGPEVLYWDSEGKQQYHKSLNKDEFITLRPNSITFLRPAERFNLPDYIAARFNLRIIHVHRGLLLGTGPLMDPGFKGYPMIPVHNLTDNEYIVRVGDEFINVEFTKINLQCNCEFLDKNNNKTTPFTYIPNMKKTCDFEFTDYVDKNVPQRKVKSSLSSAIDKANVATKNAADTLEKITKIGIIAGVIAVSALLYAGYQLTISATSIINDAREKLDRNMTATVILNDAKTRIEIEKEQTILIEQLKKKIDDLENHIKVIEKNESIKNDGITKDNVQLKK
ncbi:MAG: hypothetical protein AB9873_18335 [Syntrophobacteraceae bacterium]